MRWKILTSAHLARPSVSRDIKFANSSRSKYNRQETHTVIIFYMYFVNIVLDGRYWDFKLLASRVIKTDELAAQILV